MELIGTLTQLKIDQLAGEGWTFADIAPRQAGHLRTSLSTQAVSRWSPVWGGLRRKLDRSAHQGEKRSTYAIEAAWSENVYLAPLERLS